MKQKRLRIWLSNHLSKYGPLDTHQLRDAFNSQYHHGVSVAKVAAMLGSIKPAYKLEQTWNRTLWAWRL